MKGKIFQYINKWLSQGYEAGLPDEADPKLEALNKVPSYRKICQAILKNDVALTTLGFTRPKCDSYQLLKRIEIAARVPK